VPSRLSDVLLGERQLVFQSGAIHAVTTIRRKHGEC
jgi:hypothetical protein